MPSVSTPTPSNNVKWKCKRCTYYNTHPTFYSKCEMCNFSRSVSQMKSPLEIAITPVISKTTSIESNKTKKQQKKLKKKRKEKEETSPTSTITAATTTAAISESVSSKNKTEKKRKNSPDVANIEGKKNNVNKKSMKQRTLFGKVLSAEEEEKSSKKRKTTSSSKSKSKSDAVEILDLTSEIIQPSNNPLLPPSIQIQYDNYPALYKKSQSIMKNKFNIQSLRNLQPEAVKNCLQRKNQIIIMATGGGKSLTYQLPAATLPGLAVVISPLIALMIDQVDYLNKIGILSVSLSGKNPPGQNKEIMNQLLLYSKNFSKQQQENKSSTSLTYTNNNVIPKLIYCTPELIDANGMFRKVLTHLHNNGLLSLIALDEAHCLSTWGHEFRPAYRALSNIPKYFPNTPLIACTATATPKVIQDIKETLFRQDEVPCLTSSFNRENIMYEVRYKDILDSEKPNGSFLDLIQLIQKFHTDNTAITKDTMSGIIYVLKRDDTATLTEKIQKACAKQNIKINVAPYHAGLNQNLREQTQLDWSCGKVHLVIATVAFGMGINKANVRYVIHWNLPKTVEGFYQESGRAGRDGKPSWSILYFTQDDPSKYNFLIKKELERKQHKQMTSSSSSSMASSKASIHQATVSTEALEKMVKYCMFETSMTTTISTLSQRQQKQQQQQCRRKYLLGHFGEVYDGSDQKNKNRCCDFCSNPKKVKENIKAILNPDSTSTTRGRRKQNRFNRVGSKFSKKEAPKWDGQWDKPHGDYPDQYDDDIDEFYDDRDGFYVNHGGDGYLLDNDTEEKGGDINNNNDKKKSNKSSFGGFTKASDILEKYEALECKSSKTKSKSSGFVHFKSKAKTNTTEKKQSLRSSLLSSNSDFTTASDQMENGSNKLHQQQTTTRKNQTVTVPLHLRSKAPDPLQHFYKNKNKDDCSTKEENFYGEKDMSDSALSSEIERLKAELEKMKKKK